MEVDKYIIMPCTRHKKFLGDIIREIKGSGLESIFVDKLIFAQKILKLYPNDFTKHNNIEKLTQAKGLYSFHTRTSNKNIRILFCEKTYRNTKQYVFLCTFIEKDDKNNSPTSYNKWIKVAQNRMDEV